MFYSDKRSEMVLAPGSLLVGLLYGVKVPHAQNISAPKEGHLRAWLMINQSSEQSWLQTIWAMRHIFNTPLAPRSRGQR